MSLPRRAALLTPLLALPAWAQSAFPERTVRIIVPFPPGGLTDTMARLLGQRLSEEWGRAVVVENRAGGSAMIGAEAAARAAPDGHTLLAVTVTHAVNVTLVPNPPYDLARDLSMLSVLGSLPLVVCVNEASGPRDMAGLVALLRTRRVNAGSSGNGSPPHLALELLRQATNAGDNITHVPYRGGAPSITDLVAGNLDLIMSNLPECIGQIRGGRLRGLAVTSAARHALLPDVPTVIEAGFPGLEMTNWTGIMTAAATPAPVQALISGAIVAAMRVPALKTRAEEGGFDVLGWDADRSATFLRAETARWATLVRGAGIRPE